MNDFTVFCGVVVVFIVVIFGGLLLGQVVEHKNVETCVSNGMQWKENENAKMECVK